MYIKNQSFLVAGLSKSGLSASLFLLSRGAKVYAFDDFDNEFIKKSKLSLCEKGAIILSEDEVMQRAEQIDILVLSPGVPIDNRLPVFFKKSGKRILGEMELASLYITAPVIAITGTNGKTTTASLISQILSCAGVENCLCGNIGTPVCDKISQINTCCAVIEVSSFQLETLNSLRPHIAVITNITADHLNRHYNMENYTYLKSKLISFLRESEFAVLNYDDGEVRKLSEKTRGKTVFFSSIERVDGCFIDENKIFYNGEFIVNIDDLTIKGIHNAQNAMASVICAKLMGIQTQVIAAALKSFKGVKHRIEFVDQIKGIKFYNDSKGTNIDATVKAVSTMTDNTVIILGGKDKGYEYDTLFKSFENSKVVHAVICGENRFKMTESAKRCAFSNISVCGDLDLAVKLSSMLAKSGDAVLFSPASSSFDAFTGYEERGEYFIKKVAELKSGTKDTYQT